MGVNYVGFSGRGEGGGEFGHRGRERLQARQIGADTAKTISMAMNKKKKRGEEEREEK